MPKWATRSSTHPQHVGGCPIDAKRAAALDAAASTAAIQAVAQAERERIAAEDRRLHRAAVLRGDLLA